MNQADAKKHFPIFEAFVKGKKIQIADLFRVDGKIEKRWRDSDEYPEFYIDIEFIRIKPKTFKNFELPWDFIDKRWNFATFENGVIFVHKDRPTWCEADEVRKEGWSSRLCTYISILPIDEMVNGSDYLACRFESDVEVEA